MSVKLGQRYDVYFHLRYRCPAFLNITGPRRGCVGGYAWTVLIREATLRVRGGGQAAARRKDQRNVHAFVRGTVEPDLHVTSVFTDPDAVPVVYNPFRKPGFVTVPDGNVIEAADRVALDGGRVVAVGAVSR